MSFKSQIDTFKYYNVHFVNFRQTLQVRSILVCIINLFKFVQVEYDISFGLDASSLHRPMSDTTDVVFTVSMCALLKRRYAMMMMMMMMMIM